MSKSYLNVKEVRWLLRDKYKWDEERISDFCKTQANNLLENVKLASGLKKDIESIKRGEPVNYVIGWVEFLGCRVDLSYKSFVPRPETEYWVSKVIERYKDWRDLKVLDLCCGSGAIGIAVLKRISGSKVDFVDIDPLAIKQTLKNLRLNNVSADRYSVMRSDLFKGLKDKKYDLILCNPPYVDKEGLVPEELKYEPEAALFGGKDGIEIIDKILCDFVKFLSNKGTMYMEFGYGQEIKIKDILLKQGYNNFEFIKDQYGILRVVVVN